MDSIKQVSRPPVTRRRFAIGSLGAAMGLSGCFETGSGPDLYVANHTGSPVTVTVRIRRQRDGMTVLDDQTSIETEGNREYRDTVPEDESVEVSVIVERGVTGSYTWTRSSDAQTLFIAIRENSVNFSPATQ